MTLPILTLDELTLAPRHGYVFQRAWLQPYESAVGMLWKFAHMHRLPGHLVMSQLCDHSIDPYQAAHLPMSMFKGSRDCWEYRDATCATALVVPRTIRAISSGSARAA